jgi:hypothetical protein
MTEIATVPDSILINNIKTGQNLDDSIREIASRHTGVFMKILTPFYPSLGSFNYHSMISDKELIFYNAATSYDETKGTLFSTHVANLTKWACLKEINKKSSVEIPTEDYQFDTFGLVSEESPIDASYERDRMSLIDLIKKEISSVEDSRLRDIIRLRYFDVENGKNSWKIIGKQVGLSYQGCINLHDRYLAKIAKKLKKGNNTCLI